MAARKLFLLALPIRLLTKHPLVQGYTTAEGRTTILGFDEAPRLAFIFIAGHFLICHCLYLSLALGAESRVTEMAEDGWAGARLFLADIPVLVPTEEQSDLSSNSWMSLVSNTVSSRRFESPKAEAVVPTLREKYSSPSPVVRGAADDAAAPPALKRRRRQRPEPTEVSEGSSFSIPAARRSLGRAFEREARLSGLLGDRWDVVVPSLSFSDRADVSSTTANERLSAWGSTSPDHPVLLNNSREGLKVCEPSSVDLRSSHSTPKRISICSCPPLQSNPSEFRRELCAPAAEHAQNSVENEISRDSADITAAISPAESVGSITTAVLPHSEPAEHRMGPFADNVTSSKRKLQSGDKKADTCCMQPSTAPLKRLWAGPRMKLSFDDLPQMPSRSKSLQQMR